MHTRTLVSRALLVTLSVILSVVLVVSLVPILPVFAIDPGTESPATGESFTPLSTTEGEPPNTSGLPGEGTGVTGDTNGASGVWGVKDTGGATGTQSGTDTIGATGTQGGSGTLEGDEASGGVEGLTNATNRRGTDGLEGTEGTGTNDNTEDSLTTLDEVDTLGAPYPTGDELAATINTFSTQLDQKGLVATWVKGSSDYEGILTVTNTTAGVTAETNTATNELMLNLAPGIQVVWRAAFENKGQATLNFYSAIDLRGEGSFTVATGGSIVARSSTQILPIRGTEGVTVIIDGGTVIAGPTSNSGAIFMDADTFKQDGSPSVIVKSGSVIGYGVEPGEEVSGSPAEARAIHSYGHVRIEGGLVESTRGNAVLISALGNPQTGRTVGTVTVTGGEVKAGGSSSAIYFEGNVLRKETVVTISGTAKITHTDGSTFDGRYGAAIRTIGNVVIDGAGVNISSTCGNAIRFETGPLTITIIDGTISAETEDVIQSSAEYTGHTIDIRGGTLSCAASTAQTTRAIIGLVCSSAPTTPSAIKISGTARLLATGNTARAIDASYSNIFINDSAYLYAQAENVIDATSGKVTVTGGTITTIPDNPNPQSLPSMGKGIHTKSVDISGGTISASNGSAIRLYCARGDTSIISGGSISNASYPASAIGVFNYAAVAAYGADLTIGGVAGRTVTITTEMADARAAEKEGRSAPAVSSRGGTVTINNGATISGYNQAINMEGTSDTTYSELIINGGIIKTTADATAVNNISGNTALSKLHSQISAIFCGSKSTVTINGGLIEATDGGCGIGMYNPSDMQLVINGGEIKAKSNWALFNQLSASSNNSIIVNGGLIFAYGEVVVASDGAVLNGRAGTVRNRGGLTISGTGTLVAWNQAQGTTAYTARSATDILTEPKSVPGTSTASPSVQTYWLNDTTSGPGIFYSNAGGTDGTTETGFIPLAGLTINKATLAKDDLAYTLPQGGFTYNGLTQGIVVEGPSNVNATTGGEITVYYTGSGATSYTRSTTAPANAGTYAVEVEVSGGSDYNAIPTASALQLGTYTINKKSLTISGASIDAKTYDGTTVATVALVSFDGLQNGESLALDTDFTATGAFNSAEVANANSVTTTVVLENTSLTSNYTLPQATFMLANQSIAKKPLSIQGVTVANKTYDGTTTATVTGVVFDGLLGTDTLVLGTDFTASGVFDSSEVAQATKVTITVALQETALTNNYSLPTATKDISKTIQAQNLSDAQISITGSYTYTGSLITPNPAEVAVALDGGTLQYGTDYSFAVTQGGTNAGQAELTMSGTGNYTGTATKSFIIASAPLSGSLSIIESVNGGEDGKIDAGDALACDISSLLPTGVSASDLTYIWYLDGEQAATSATYTLPQDSTGKLITVKIQGAGNYSGTIESAAIKVGFLLLQGDGSIAGATTLGNTLTLSPNLGAATYTTEWLRNGNPIAEARGTTYTVTKDDLGCTISARMVGAGTYYGEVSSSNSLAIPAVAPDKPSVIATPQGTSITLTWSEPFHGGSPIKGYRASLDNGVTWVDALGTSHTFSGLTPGRSYTIHVVAHSDAGTGAASITQVDLPAVAGPSSTATAASGRGGLASTGDGTPVLMLMVLLGAGSLALAFVRAARIKKRQ